MKKIHSFLTDREKVKSELYWIRKVWYVLLLVLSTVYVGCNFCQLMKQNIITQFDGNSLIFILWIILLFLPLFNRIEGYGFKFSKELEEQEKQTIQLQLLRDDIVNEDKIASKEDIEKMLFDTINQKDKNE